MNSKEGLKGKKVLEHHQTVEPCDELASHPMGVTIFLFASSYRTEKASFYFLYR